MCHWISALALLFMFSLSVPLKKTNRHQQLNSKAVRTQHSLPHSSPALWISVQELQAEPEGVAPEGLTEAEPGPCPSPPPNWVFLVPVWAYRITLTFWGQVVGGPGPLTLTFSLDYLLWGTFLGPGSRSTVGSTIGLAWKDKRDRLVWGPSRGRVFTVVSNE